MINEIIQHLPSTMEYCNNQINKGNKYPANILRSVILEYQGQSIYNGDEQIQDWNLDYFENTSILQGIYNEQLKVKKLFNKKEPHAFNGKLFCFNYMNTLVCGGSQANSDGLIDNYNFPPIDTWVWLGTYKEDKLLIAWIPDEYIDLAQKAIDTNPEGCIDWLNEWYPEIETEITKLYTTVYKKHN